MAAARHPQVIKRHTADEIRGFATDLHISSEQAGFIEFMRDRYICFEHDYVAAIKKKKTKRSREGASIGR